MLNVLAQNATAVPPSSTLPMLVLQLLWLKQSAHLLTHIVPLFETHLSTYSFDCFDCNENLTSSFLDREVSSSLHAIHKLDEFVVQIVELYSVVPWFVVVFKRGLGQTFPPKQHFY